MGLGDILQAQWYADGALARALRPLSVLCELTARRRRRRFLAEPPGRVPVPVVVVGNITVGGTGKTPMVVWLVEWLRAQGWKPGVVSRGYRASAGGDMPYLVSADDDAVAAGDEPLLIARRTRVPVAICRRRPAAVVMLIEKHGCDIVVSDDGLQHYRLWRDIEIAMLDGRRRLGNGRCLPSGPLREPADRLDEVDFVLVAEGSPAPGEFGVNIVMGEARRIGSLDELRPLTAFAGKPVHAVAGIGNPERFFSALERAGLSVIRHPLPDHHPIAPRDIAFGDGRAVLMTEKDAVKCRAFASPDTWYVPIEAMPERNWIDAFGERLRSVVDGQETA